MSGDGQSRLGGRTGALSLPSLAAGTSCCQPLSPHAHPDGRSVVHTETHNRCDTLGSCCSPVSCPWPSGLCCGGGEASLATHALRAFCLQTSRAVTPTITATRNTPALTPSITPLKGSAGQQQVNADDLNRRRSAGCTGHAHVHAHRPR